MNLEQTISHELKYLQGMSKTSADKLTLLEATSDFSPTERQALFETLRAYQDGVASVRIILNKYKEGKNE